MLTHILYLNYALFWEQMTPFILLLDKVAESRLHSARVCSFFHRTLWAASGSLSEECLVPSASWQVRNTSFLRTFFSGRTLVCILSGCLYQVIIQLTQVHRLQPGLAILLYLKNSPLSLPYPLALRCLWCPRPRQAAPPSPIQRGSHRHSTPLDARGAQGRVAARRELPAAALGDPAACAPPHARPEPHTHHRRGELQHGHTMLLGRMLWIR